MKFTVHAVSAALVLLLTLAPTAPATAALPVGANGEGIPSLAPMIKESAPAVVNIATRGRAQVQQHPFLDDPFFRRFFEGQPSPRQRQTQSAGSGVIVDAEKGLIVTNHHVIESAEEITVILQNDRSYTATVIGSDPGSDIAVVQIEADGLTALPFADSEAAEVGDFVVAIGNPFGLGHTVTSGIISALGRSGLNPDGYEDFIQTDASINPGNSGGALVNLRGELVGVNSAIISRGGGNIGIGFAIPSNMVLSVMDQIVEFGEVRRGLLGVEIYTVTPDIADAYGLEEPGGALVSTVAPDSAAQDAGIKTGDVIVSVNGEPVKSAGELRNAIGLLRIGEDVRIGIIRDGRDRTVRATLGERPSDVRVAAAEIHSGLAGASFGSADPDAPDSQGVAGVEVLNVDDGSPAAQRGLRQGDVIVRVNRKRVESVPQLREAATDTNPLLLEVRRGNAALLLHIR